MNKSVTRYERIKNENLKIKAAEKILPEELQLLINQDKFLTDVHYTCKIEGNSQSLSICQKIINLFAEGNVDM